MRACANLPLAGRDLRLDLFRGLANWAIFLDHIPHEVMNSITTRNYGFSDAADLGVWVHVVLLGRSSLRLYDPDDLNQCKVAFFMSHPLREMSQALLLRYRP